MASINAIPTYEIQQQRERLLHILAAIAFMIFFQGYMVAPLIPRLAITLGVSAQKIGLIVPAYLIPYGISTLFFGLLSDWMGRKWVMLVSLTAFVILTGFTAISATANQLIFWRLLTGLGASGVVPQSVLVIGTLFPYNERGRPIGWLFGAMAGGMAFGSTFGVILEPMIGIRGIFLGVSACGVLTLLLLRPYLGLFGERPSSRTLTLSAVATGYRQLLNTRRGQRTFLYVFVNATFHSGVFTWLGLLFARRYGLGEVGIGVALLGYGVPGFVLGTFIGRVADKWGRSWLIPSGLALAALSACLFVPAWPLPVAVAAVTLLSFGYDMTQPPLAGIVTSLDSERAGQAMGLNVFSLFTGFGLGSLLFGWAIEFGFTNALMIFVAIQSVAALAAVQLFRSEKRES